MESLLLLFLGFYQCDSATMKNGFGEQCTEIVEKYAPKPAGIPSKWGFVPTGGLTCSGYGKLLDGQCEKRYLVVED